MFRKHDHLGQKCFVNIRTGNTSFSDPSASADGCRVLKGITLTCPSTVEHCVQHINLPQYSSLVAGVDAGLPVAGTEILSEEMKTLIDSWINPAFHIPEKDVIGVEDVATASKKRRTSRSQCFTKKMLENDIKVLNSVDNKFIACLVDINHSEGDRLLILIDQHAAHERIRLEQQMQDAYHRSKQRDDELLRRTVVSPPVFIKLSETEVQLMATYRHSFHRIGIKFTTDKLHSDRVAIHSVPSCLLECTESSITRPDATSLNNYVLLVQETKGASSSTLPGVLHQVLCSWACHGAIKFGEYLALPQCVRLVKQLAKCQLPFQCAHGRPSVVPLLDTKHLASILTRQETLAPNLQKLKKQRSAEIS